MRKQYVLESNDSLTYWPNRGIGMLGMIFMAIMSGVGICLALWRILDDGLQNVWREVLIYCCPIFVFLLTIPWIIMASSIKIEINYSGIRTSNKLKINELIIFWEDVDEVHFCADLQFGISSCRIVSKRSSPKGNIKTNTIAVLPLHLVGRNKIEKFIPPNIIVLTD